MSESRIPGFYKFSVPNRLQILLERDIISKAEYQMLIDGTPIMGTATADRLVENVISVFGLPLGLGLNFKVNGRDTIIPMAVEEPSIIAAVSAMAKLARNHGGFTSQAQESLLIGQVQLTELDDPVAAGRAVLANQDEILNLANSLHPNMVARGGGAQAIELKHYPEQHMLVVHILVDTCDAMGANLVNTICEGTAPLLEKITGGRAGLRILSNLADRALVTAQVSLPCEALATAEQTGEQVRDGIIQANEFARLDPHRAATHNKGIMNGIDAVAIATGNDWRAIEAGAHAYAARDGQYRALTQWQANADGDLVGELTLPLKVATVGGQVQANRAVALAQHILGVNSAKQLAEIMAAVGLAQNLAAIKALSTEGIQRGHMSLHARSVAAAAGAEADIFENVVEALINEGPIKIWRAKEIITSLQEQPKTPQRTISPNNPLATGTDKGFGKVILLGEHSVVYGQHAIAAPIPLSVQATVRQQHNDTVRLVIPRWGIETTLDEPGRAPSSLHQSLVLIIKQLGLSGHGMQIEVFPHVPRANGLGASAALAVAVIRAIVRCFNLDVDDASVCQLAYSCEKFAHGMPSGLDNTLATYGQTLLFKKTDQGPHTQALKLARPIPLVVSLSGVQTLTAQTVGAVRKAWQQYPQRYERIFAEIDALVLAGVQALETGDLATLADLMNIDHGLLNALQVSSPQLEHMIQIAREHGALGAKLTGGGGGGAMIATAEPDQIETVAQALRQQGYHTFVTQIGAPNHAD